MKGFIFIIIVTIMVLASFARPDKEIRSSPSLSTGVSKSNNNKVVQDSSTVRKQGS